MLYITIGLIVVLIGVFVTYKSLSETKKRRLKPYLLAFSILVLVVLLTEVALTIGGRKKVEPTKTEAPRVSAPEGIETVTIDIQIKRAPSTAPTAARWEKLPDRALVLNWANVKNMYQSDESGLVKDVQIPAMGKVEYEVWHNKELEQEGSFDYNKANKEGVLEILIRNPK
jgi:hypothetical protein